MSSLDTEHTTYSPFIELCIHLVLFWRYSELFVKVTIVSYARIFGTLFGMTVSEIQQDLWHQKTRVPGSHVALLAWHDDLSSDSEWQYTKLWQTDTQTNSKYCNGTESTCGNNQSVHSEMSYLLLVMLLMFRLLVFGLVFPFARLTLVLAWKWSNSCQLNIGLQIRAVQQHQQDHAKYTVNNKKTLPVYC